MQCGGLEVRRWLRWRRRRNSLAPLKTLFWSWFLNLINTNTLKKEERFSLKEAEGLQLHFTLKWIQFVFSLSRLLHCSDSGMKTCTCILKVWNMEERESDMSEVNLGWTTTCLADDQTYPADRLDWAHIKLWVLLYGCSLCQKHSNMVNPRKPLNINNHGTNDANLTIMQLFNSLYRLFYFPKASNVATFPSAIGDFSGLFETDVNTHVVPQPFSERHRNPSPVHTISSKNNSG